jgi:hypothetical protein
MLSRFIVIAAARAEGTTQYPSRSTSSSTSVRIASTSGTMKSGRCLSIAALSFSASSIEKISCPSATCMAGAPA